jgi:hypothetical protein
MLPGTRRDKYGARPGYQERGAWLGLMQYYGLPTRLFDWTRLTLVAAHLALEDYTLKRHAVALEDEKCRQSAHAFKRKTQGALHPGVKPI